MILFFSFSSNCDLFQRKLCISLVFSGKYRIDQSQSAYTSQIHQQDQYDLGKNMKARCDSQCQTYCTYSRGSFIQAV